MGRLTPYVQRTFSHAFEISVAVVWFLVGLSYVAAPQYTALHSPLARPFGIWEWVWSGMYLVAGPAVVWGVWRRELGLRVGGLILLTTGLTIQFVGALTAPIGFRTFTYLTYAGACAAKLWLLHGVYRKGRVYQL